MKSSFRLFVLFFGLLSGSVSGLPGTVLAQTPVLPAHEPVSADRIAAVVNDEVITLNELRARLALTTAQLQRQGTPMPPRDELERQILERMVMNRVQVQYARDNGLRIDDAQLDQAIERIAARNDMNLPQLREALQKDGVPFSKFREDIREEMLVARIREREVDNKTTVSEGEIDSYLSGDSTSGGNEEYELAHILLRLPESASPEQLREQRAKAEQLAERLHKGEDFTQLAAAFSDAPDALQGGRLERRPLDRLPTLFANAVLKLKPGELGPILQSANGFHLVKLIAKHGGTELPAVQQTHARHILIKVNDLVSEADARHKLEGLYERIKHGERFADLAKLYSQDGSAAKGGDLGWIYPGDTVPEFERAMDRLRPGELSEPVRSPFGFHLVEVLERRQQDLSADRQRAAARQLLRERKADEAYQDWLRQARDRAYVEFRLEER